MATFFMFGKYSSDAASKITIERTELVRKRIEDFGGKLKEVYALLGEYDVVLIVELPRMTEAMQVSIVLNRLTGISFSTAAALPVEEFDQLVGQL